MSTKIPPLMTNVSSNREYIDVMFWRRGAIGSMDVTLKLTEADARSLAAELLAAADKMPRIGTAADLGLEVLP